jgi:hypothetical protein
MRTDVACGQTIEETTCCGERTRAATRDRQALILEATGTRPQIRQRTSMYTDVGCRTGCPLGDIERRLAHHFAVPVQPIGRTRHPAKRKGMDTAAIDIGRHTVKALPSVDKLQEETRRARRHRCGKVLADADCRERTPRAEDTNAEKRKNQSD